MSRRGTQEEAGLRAQEAAEAAERELIAVALGLGALDIPDLSQAETELIERLAPPRAPARTLGVLRKLIAKGRDPLGEAFCGLRSPEARRPLGATYTPERIVRAMVEWTASEGKPERVVDPGAGSARFAVAAGRRFPHAQLVGVEVDPLAALLGRAHLASAGLAKRSHVLVTDYRLIRLDPVEGKTVYLGNPPYVRHHQIEPRWKEWLVSTAHSLGLGASQLAGLHVHFFLATVARAVPDDIGAFITSAEWLDVNYGSLVRELVLDGLGGQAIHLVEPTATPFEDAITTAAITCFRIGSRPGSVRLRRVKEVAQLGKLDQGQRIRRERLAEARRWTPLTRRGRKMPDGYVELGELCRVHRGTVTGSNATWIVARDFLSLPESVLFPSITRARELFEAVTILDTVEHLRRVIDLPPDLDEFDSDERRLIDRYLRAAKRSGAAKGYVARHRKAWWSVGLRDPAPILATYMARRPPVFVRNDAEARYVNIAHGLYPREKMSRLTLDRLAESLRSTVTMHQGRTYAGGLTKFEPKEMERLPVPSLELLAA